MIDPKTDDLRFRICERLGLLQPCDLDPSIPPNYNAEGVRRNVRQAYKENGARAWRLLLSTMVLSLATLYFVGSLVLECLGVVSSSDFFDLGVAGAALVGATVFPNVVTTSSPSRDLPGRAMLLVRIQHDAVALGLLIGTPAWAIGKCNLALWATYGLIVTVIVLWQFRDD